MQGPGIVAAGRNLCMTGGHGWTMGWECDGPDACRKAAREELKAGVDVIKIMATGGVMTPGVEPGSPQLTEEEMRAAIEEAHKAGRKTATHAQGNTGIKNALRAGIDSIEHGCYLDEESIGMMLKNGTYLVPTLAAPRNIVDYGVENGVPEYAVKKSLVVMDNHIRSFQDAYKAGVKIAMGTDSGTPFNSHSGSAFEMQLMVEAGMAPGDAIVAATRNAAECLDILERTGTLEVGKAADIIALPGDPLLDIKALKTVEDVFKDGVKLK